MSYESIMRFKRTEEHALPKVTVIHRGSQRDSKRESKTASVINGSTVAELNNILLDVNTLSSERDSEARLIRECNEKLGNYLERSRFYELQNKRLEKEIADLKDNMGKEATRIKKMYETEIEEVKMLLEKAQNERGTLEERLRKAEQALLDLDNKIEEEVKRTKAEKLRGAAISEKILNLEADLIKVRAEIGRSEQERNELKKESDVLRDRARDLRADVDEETVTFLNAKSLAHALKEELEFFKSTTDQERKDLEKLAFRDITLEAREAWKSEISVLFRELHDKFDTQLGQIRSELESQFKRKVNEVRTNQAKGSVEIAVLVKDYERLTAINTDLKARLATLEPRCAFLEAQAATLAKQIEERNRENEKMLSRLRDDLDKANSEIKRLGIEVHKILTAKVSLEVEIAQYRKLLESEMTEGRAFGSSFVSMTSSSSSSMSSSGISSLKK
jgi:intermediate filament protein if